MATPIKMPKLGLSMVEAKLVKWLKAEGDEVAEGDLLAVVETNKIAYEVAAPGAGVLLKILVPATKVAPVGGVMAVIGARGEALDLSQFSVDSAVPQAALPGGFDPLTTQLGREGRGRFGERAASVSAATTSAVPPAGGTSAAPRAAAVAAPAPASAAGRVQASPLARRIAAEAGVDLSRIAGTGPGGRIERADVEHAISSGGPSTPAPVVRPMVVTSDPAAYPRVPYELMRKPPTRAPMLGTMRGAIAENMRRSKRVAAHATMSLKADVGQLKELRRKILERTAEREGVRVTFTDLVVKAVARALVRNPMLRTVIDGEDLVTMNDIDIAVAVHLEEAGLVVPVIRDCDTRSLIEIARERTRLMEAARSGGLGADELAGGCFSITNMGAVYELDFGTPILNLPQSAILGIGSIKDEVVARDGVPVVRPMMNLFLSIDHCVIDGEPSVRFLNEVRDFLEEPALGLAV